MDCTRCKRPVQTDNLHGKPADARGYCLGNTTCLQQEPKRTLGDLTTYELISTAKFEAMAMGAKLDDVELNADDRLVLGAYIGSITARLSIAQAR